MAFSLVFDRFSVPADIIGRNTSFAYYRPIQNWPKQPIFGILADIIGIYRPKCHFSQILLAA